MCCQNKFNVVDIDDPLDFEFWRISNAKINSKTKGNIMLIERYVAPYSVFIDESIIEALRKISDNKAGLVFAVTEAGELVGVMTDGDFRRWLVKQSTIDLTQSVSCVISRDYVSVKEGTPADEIESHLVGKVQIIQSSMIGTISSASQSTAILNLELAQMSLCGDSSTFVIAEIGNNHNGSLEMAKDLVNQAKLAGADCAKFQMRQLGSIYLSGGNPSDVSEDLGAQYVLDLLTRFSLSNEELFEVFDYCKSQGIMPLCTPWDEDSLSLLEGYGLDAYKVASADLTNHLLLKKIAATANPLSSQQACQPSLRSLKQFKF